MSLVDAYIGIAGERRQRRRSLRRSDPRNADTSRSAAQRLADADPERPRDTFDLPSPEEAQFQDAERQARRLGETAARDYSPLPDEMGWLVPPLTAAADLLAIPTEDRDRRIARSTEQAGVDVLGQGHGQELIDLVRGIGPAMGEAQAARDEERMLRGQSPQNLLERAGSLVGDFWTGWPEANRDARARAVAEGVMSDYWNTEQELALQSGEPLGPTGRRMRQADARQDRAYGDQFWGEAPALLEFVPGVGMLNPVPGPRVVARTGAELAERGATSGVSREALRDAPGPLTQEARSATGALAAGGAAGVIADQLSDGQIGDDPLSTAAVGGGVALAMGPRGSRRLGAADDALRATRVADDATYAFEGAPQMQTSPIDVASSAARRTDLPTRGYHATTADVRGPLFEGNGVLGEGAYHSPSPNIADELVFDEEAGAFSEGANIVPEMLPALDRYVPMSQVQNDLDALARERGIDPTDARFWASDSEALQQELLNRYRSEGRVGIYDPDYGGVGQMVTWGAENRRAPWARMSDAARASADPLASVVPAAVAGAGAGYLLSGEAEASNGAGDGAPILPVLGGVSAATLAALVSRRPISRRLNSQAGMFAGVNARTADRAALTRAQEMAQQGASRDDIWRETGWFQGVDGKWRFEIDDSGAQIAPDMLARHSGGSVGSSQRRPLSEGLQHPELNDAYDLSDTTLDFGRLSRGAVGEYDNSRRSISMYAADDPDMLRSGTLHETQHRVQREEGFATGGTPESAWGVNEQASLDAIRAQMKEALGGRDPYAIQNRIAAGYRVADEDMAALEQWRALTRQEDEILANTLSPREAYRRLGGETEARNVQTRRDFTPEERRSRPPWETQDVPDADQIIRFDGGIAESASPRRLGQQRMAAAIRDPETGAVYTGANHFDAIESAPEAVRARLEAAYAENGADVGFAQGEEFFAREDAMRRLGEAAEPARLPLNRNENTPELDGANTGTSSERRYRRFTQEEVDQIIALTGEGINPAEIARRMGARRNQVIAALDRAGVAESPGTRGAAPAHNERDMAWLRENEYGLSVTTIANREGVSRGAVAGAIRRARRRLGRDTDAASQALETSSAADEAAAQRLGMSVERYRAFSARRRNDASAIAGLTAAGAGGAALLADEANAQDAQDVQGFQVDQTADVPSMATAVGSPRVVGENNDLLVQEFSDGSRYLFRVDRSGERTRIEPIGAVVGTEFNAPAQEGSRVGLGSGGGVATPPPPEPEPRQPNEIDPYAGIPIGTALGLMVSRNRPRLGAAVGAVTGGVTAGALGGNDQQVFFSSALPAVLAPGGRAALDYGIDTAHALSEGGRRRIGEFANTLPAEAPVITGARVTGDNGILGPRGSVRTDRVPLPSETQGNRVRVTGNEMAEQGYSEPLGEGLSQRGLFDAMPPAQQLRMADAARADEAARVRRIDEARQAAASARIDRAAQEWGVRDALPEQGSMSDTLPAPDNAPRAFWFDPYTGEPVFGQRAGRQPPPRKQRLPVDQLRNPGPRIGRSAADRVQVAREMGVVAEGEKVTGSEAVGRLIQRALSDEAFRNELRSRFPALAAMILGGAAGAMMQEKPRRLASS